MENQMGRTRWTAVAAALAVAAWIGFTCLRPLPVEGRPRAARKAFAIFPPVQLQVRQSLQVTVNNALGQGPIHARIGLMDALTGQAIPQQNAEMDLAPGKGFSFDVMPPPVDGPTDLIVYIEYALTFNGQKFPMPAATLQLASIGEVRGIIAILHPEMTSQAITGTGG